MGGCVCFCVCGLVIYLQMEQRSGNCWKKLNKASREESNNTSMKMFAAPRFSIDEIANSIRHCYSNVSFNPCINCLLLLCVCLGIEHQLVLGTWVRFAYIYNGPTRTLTGAVGLESDILHLHFSSRFSESPRLLVASCVVLKKQLHFCILGSRNFSNPLLFSKFG